MKVVTLEQGSSQWLEWRRDGIGGSDAAAVLGVSPYRTAGDLLIQKTRPKPADQPTTFAMRRGTKLEPIVRRLYVERTGILAAPLCVEHDEAPWLRASLDGWFGPDAGGPLGVVLEIKCPKWTDHEYALEGCVPKHYRPQLAHACLATGAELCHYVSWNDGKEHFPDRRDHFALVPYRPRDDELGELLEREEAFWRQVEAARAELSHAA